MNLKAWIFYWRFYRRGRHQLIFSLGQAVIQGLLNLWILFLIRFVFHAIIPQKNFSALISIAIGIVVLYIISELLSLGIRCNILKVTKIAIQEIREEILKKYYAFSLMRLNQSDYKKFHTVAVKDTDCLDIMSNALFAQLLPALCISVSITCILVYFNWRLVIIMIGFVPLLLLADGTIGVRVKKHVSVYRQSFDRFSKSVLMFLEKMDLTRIQSAENIELNTQRENIATLRSLGFETTRLTTIYSIIQHVIFTSCGIIILVVGGSFLGNGRMGVGEFLSFYTALVFLRVHLYTISSCIPQLIEGNESLDAIYTFLQTDAFPPYGGNRKTSFHGSIRFESVYFQFNTHPVINNLNLKIPAGTIVGIVGPNGVGKTTIANLILGFYRPQKGIIFSDDVPYAEIDISHMRRSIRIVRQNPTVFSGSIFQNITYGTPTISHQEVIRAAELAIAHEFIAQQPLGYETMIGEGGILLSGGQRQRIAIARAILGRPRLLILDEPANHLDTLVLHRLLENLKKLESQQTVLIISHDISIMQGIKQIYILQEGGVIAAGNYATSDASTYAREEHR